MTQDHKAKLWALSDGFFPVHFEIRQRLRDGSLDFWATTGDYDPADVLEGLRAVKAGYGGPDKVTRIGVQVQNPDAIRIPDITHQRDSSFGFSLTLVPKRGLLYPFKKGARVKLVSDVGGAVMGTSALIHRIEALEQIRKEMDS